MKEYTAVPNMLKAKRKAWYVVDLSAGYCEPLITCDLFSFGCPANLSFKSGDLTTRTTLITP
jgi:hypothetical protein